MTGTQPLRNSKRFWFTIAACAVIYLPALCWSFGLDQNIFAEAASLMLRGKKLYVDAWDVKPPNIFYIYSLFQAVFGEREISIRIADYLSVLGGCGAMFACVAELVGNDLHILRRWAPCVAAIVMSLTMLSLGLADTAQAESFSLPFILAAAYLILRKRTRVDQVLAGALIGIAIFLKTTNGIFLIAIIAEIVLQRIADRGDRLLGRLGLLLAGAIGWCLVQFGGLLLSGSLTAYLAVLMDVARVHPNEVSTLAIGDFFRTSWVLLDILLVLGFVGLLVALRVRAIRGAIRLPVLMLVAGVIAVWVQNKGWGYHYVIMLPGLIVLAVLGLFVLLDRLHSPRLQAGALVLVLLVFAVAGPSGRRRMHNVQDAARSISNHDAYIASLGSQRTLYYPRCTEALARYITAHSRQADRVFILGDEPGAYWRSGRMPASRYLYALLLTSGVIDSAGFRTMTEDVRRAEPSLVIVETTDTTAFRNKPETSYSLLMSDARLSGLKRYVESRYILSDTLCDKFLIYTRVSDTLRIKNLGEGFVGGSSGTVKD